MGRDNRRSLFINMEEDRSMKKMFGKIMIVLFVPALLWGATGDVLKQFPTPGSCPTGLTFDGEHLWVADRKSDSLYQIELSGGKVVKRFPTPGFFPTGVAWDGKHLWMTDQDFRNTSTEVHTGKIYMICPKTGITLKMIEAPSADPQGLTWDGEFLWVSDNVEDKIYRISPEDGTTVAEFGSPASDPHGLAWDGHYLWVSDRTEDEIYRVNPKSGLVVMILSSPGPYPRGLTWMGETLWNVDYQTDTVYRIKVFDDIPYSRKNERFASVEYTHDVMNLGPGTVRDLDIYIAEPRNRDSQEIVDVSYSSEPFGFLTDRWGQRVAHFRVENMKPGDRFVPVMRVKVKSYEVMYHIFPERVGKLEDIPEDIRQKYLVDGSKYWINDPFIQSSVRKAVGDIRNPYWIARNIFDYIRVRMEYERVGGWNVAPTVLERGSGSCSEYTFVYIAMCRAAGLPARYVGAVAVRGDEASLDYVYHRWVEVYLPGYGWIPVDPSRGDRAWPRDQAMSFGHLSNQFLITTEGGGGSEYLGWDYNSSERWSAEGPVRLRMEKIGEWEPTSSP